MRKCHDGLERQGCAMSIVAVRDASHGMAKDFDGRLGEMLVVIRRTSLAKIFEHPRLFFPCLDARLRFDPGKVA